MNTYHPKEGLATLLKSGGNTVVRGAGQKQFQLGDVQGNLDMNMVSYSHIHSNSSKQHAQVIPVLLMDHMNVLLACTFFFLFELLIALT